MFIAVNEKKEVFSMYVPAYATAGTTFWEAGDRRRNKAVSINHAIS
jgi:hypothetical protein